MQVQNMLRGRLLRVLTLLGSTVAISCAHAPAPLVHPWQREYLGKRALQFDGEDEKFRNHLHGSREGADLGYGQPGGGCGCN
jgi:hypothetical protein